MLCQLPRYFRLRSTSRNTNGKNLSPPNNAPCFSSSSASKARPSSPGARCLYKSVSVFSKCLSFELLGYPWGEEREGNKGEMQTWIRTAWKSGGRPKRRIDSTKQWMHFRWTQARNTSPKFVRVQRTSERFNLACFVLRAFWSSSLNFWLFSSLRTVKLEDQVKAQSKTREGRGTDDFGIRSGIHYKTFWTRWHWTKNNHSPQRASWRYEGRRTRTETRRISPIPLRRYCAMRNDERKRERNKAILPLHNHECCGHEITLDNIIIRNRWWKVTSQEGARLRLVDLRKLLIHRLIVCQVILQTSFHLRDLLRKLREIEWLMKAYGSNSSHKIRHWFTSLIASIVPSETSEKRLSTCWILETLIRKERYLLELQSQFSYLHLRPGLLQSTAGRSSSRWSQQPQ